MPLDLRAEAARYYDLNPATPGDIEFYLNRLPGPQARILELGCGTGRVSIPLAQHGCYVHGLDLSEAMLALCEEKVADASLTREQILVEHADITEFDLNQTFDLVIAPFRVIQNLETDLQLDGLFRCIRRHLAPTGRCILNVFNPSRPRDQLLETWVAPGENLAWEIEKDGERMTCHDARRRLVENPLVLYPELIYRRWQEDQMLEEAVLPIPMRVFYPNEFSDLIRSAGFTITGQWGGYDGEAYGEGNELVIEFES